jgi:hypothetical protein
MNDLQLTIDDLTSPLQFPERPTGNAIFGTVAHVLVERRQTIAGF